MITPDQLTKAANDLRLALGLNHEEAEPILRHLQRLVEQERKRAADIVWKMKMEHFGGGTAIGNAIMDDGAGAAMVSRGVPLEACEAMSDAQSSTRPREQRDEALAEAERLSRSDETFRRLWNDLSSGTDGNNWYWLEYGEKCYAYAVVSAITENERDEKRTPPPGTKLEPTESGGWVWKGLAGVRMVSDENITFIERQDGGVICRFIAGSFAYAKERFGNMAAAAVNTKGT